MELKSELLIFDSLHCQTLTHDYIVKECGDCILQVKGNQSKLYKTVKTQFAEHIEANPDAECFTHDDKGHGRIEKCITFQCPLNLPAELSTKWARLKTLKVVEHHRKIGNKTSIDTDFYVSNAEMTAQVLGLRLGLIRKGKTISTGFWIPYFKKINRKCIMKMVPVS